MTATGNEIQARVDPGPPGARPGTLRSAQLVRLGGSPTVRRLGMCLTMAIVLAVITGPPGSNGAPTSGFTGSLKFPRFFWFLGFGVVIFVLFSVWSAFGRETTSRANRFRSSILELVAKRQIRLALDLAIAGFGIVWVSWISPGDTWKGGVCIQIGFALAAMELVVYLSESRSLKIARLGGYGCLAVYGVLAWMHNGVSAYLNNIGAVPHQGNLGILFLWLALGLAVLEGLLTLLSIVRKAVEPRRYRSLTGLGATVLLAYGWLMWTRWALWRASTPHSVAHWFASIHLLPHNHSAGLAVMGLGAAVALAAIAWVATDLFNGTRPEHARYEFTGITKQAKFAYGRTAVTIAALLIAIEWPLHMDPGIQSILTTQVAIYVLLAIGLNVVVGFAGLLDLGYVAFWAIGAYTAAYFTGALPIQPPFILNPFWIIPFAIIAAMLTGVVIGTPTLRLRGDYLAIVTLGFGEIIEIVANNLNGITGGPAGTPGFVPQFSVHIFGVDYAWTGTVLPYYFLILGVALIFMVGFSFLEHSRVGRSWTAIREDEVAADSVGINALKYKVMAFAIGASTSGFAGVFFASQIQSLVPNDFLVQTSILILVFVIFGGMGSIAGAVIGAFLIQWLPQYLQVHSFQDYQSQDEFIYLGGLLILLMIFRPQGIIPSRRRRREILLTEEGIVSPESPGGPVRITSLGEELPSDYGRLSLDEPGYIGPETE
jgi:branched-chain amino acid transport system permease protein